MNKEIIYYKDKALVVNDNNEKKEVDYTDNLKDILIKEEIIETMKSRINEIEKELNEPGVSDCPKKKRKERWMLFFCMATVPYFILTSVAAFSNIIHGVSFFNAIVEAFKLFVPLYHITFPAVFFAATITLAFETISNKTDTKKYNGLKSELDNLKMDLEKETKIVEELKKDKRNTNSSEKIECVNLNCKEELEKLREKIISYYDLGYKNGILEEKDNKHVLSKKMKKN